VRVGGFLPFFRPLTLRLVDPRLIAYLDVDDTSVTKIDELEVELEVRSLTRFLDAFVGLLTRSSPSRLSLSTREST
jgi:hypothetical protein